MSASSTRCRSCVSSRLLRPSESSKPHRVETPWPHPLELDLAAVGELEARTGDEVARRRCDENLACVRLSGYTGSDVDRDAARGSTRRPFHLPRVDARTDLQSERAHGVADADATANGSRRPVEESEETVAPRCRSPRRRTARSPAARARDGGSTTLPKHGRRVSALDRSNRRCP